MATQTELIEYYEKLAGAWAKRAQAAGDDPAIAASLAQTYATLALTTALKQNSARTSLFGQGIDALIGAMTKLTRKLPAQ
ncbi:hypothetical protein [Streptomyces sp. MP131-18]|uniref:hypothetical protein n=1 Tax=Streptomyces sp. MP131-18 TaxID=1857892 RepID=UPI00097BC2C0|nr:hypothetical protein [Streptomyces sp. MP131-18]ONK09295.1 hypothetical protein STBA_71500 [Streptomyces sp. MP131-18]